jgi:hypothetical protein
MEAPSVSACCLRVGFRRTCLQRCASRLCISSLTRVAGLGFTMSSELFFCSLLWSWSIARLPALCGGMHLPERSSVVVAMVVCPGVASDDSALVDGPSCGFRPFPSTRDRSHRLFTVGDSLGRKALTCLVECRMSEWCRRCLLSLPCEQGQLAAFEPRFPFHRTHRCKRWIECAVSHRHGSSTSAVGVPGRAADGEYINCVG